MNRYSATGIAAYITGVFIASIATYTAVLLASFTLAIGGALMFVTAKDLEARL